MLSSSLPTGYLGGDERSNVYILNPLLTLKIYCKKYFVLFMPYFLQTQFLVEVRPNYFNNYLDVRKKILSSNIFRIKDYNIVKIKQRSNRQQQDGYL